MISLIAIYDYMKSFETDHKDLLDKMKDIVDDYVDTCEADLRYVPARRKIRELKKVSKALEKWKSEL